MPHSAIESITADIAIQPGAVVSKVIHSDDRFNVTVIGFDAHQELTGHQLAPARGCR